MEKCQECGKKFRSSRALGGHMSTVHAKQSNSSTLQVAAQSQNEAEAKPPGGKPPEVPDNVKETGEPSVSDSIRKLLGEGYSPRQIKGTFGYAPSTVDQVTAAFVEPDGNPVTDKKGDGLPVLRKIGQGVEVITPEAVLRRYMNGEGDEEELRGMMKLRAAMLMVMDLINMRKADAEAFALEVKPIIELMKETREEQDSAAERARASTEEAAEGAATETVKGIMPWLEERLKEVETAAKQRVEKKEPAYPQFMKMMDGMMSQVFRPFMATFGMSPQSESSLGQREIPGFSYKKVKEG
jgi:hypothetical protein